jgi:transglutaminase-like putative cysteine protease
MMEPVGTNVFFLAPFAEEITGNYRSVVQDLAGSVSSEEPIGIYLARSNVTEIRAELLRKASGNLPAEIALNYLQLPKLDPRIAPLAAEITSGQSNDYDRARAIEIYLMSHYTYTLKLSERRPHDPLAEFLFDRKQGHCEYFASAMAIMLRTLRIPSRIVNGFRNGQFNDLTSSYIVRASEAHTWVEVYFPNYGWSTFDPTPPDPGSTSLLRTSRVGLYLDALGEFWREWVINYDFTHQSSLSFRTAMLSRNRLSNWKLDIMRRYYQLVARARTTDPGQFLRRYGPVLLILVVLLVLVVNSGTLLRFWRNCRIAANPEEAPRAAASIWYERMTASLARRGCQKRAAQTPAEFATSIPDPSLRRAVLVFTQHYHRARFGEMSEDAKRLPQLYEEVEAAARG